VEEAADLDKFGCENTFFGEFDPALKSAATAKFIADRL
jgi:hypothetical protein